MKSNKNYEVNEIDENIYEIKINEEIVKIDLTDSALREDLENMGLIKKDDDESFHGYLIKSAIEWIAKTKVDTTTEENLPDENL